MGLLKFLSGASVAGIATALLSHLRSGLSADAEPTPDAARLSYTSEGRFGHVQYQSAVAQFSLYYEFGGGDCVAMIEVPNANQWVERTGLPLTRRDDVLRWIGERVVKDQTTGGAGRFAIEGDWLNIYVR